MPPAAHPPACAAPPWCPRWRSFSALASPGRALPLPSAYYSALDRNRPLVARFHACRRFRPPLAPDACPQSDKILGERRSVTGSRPGVVAGEKANVLARHLPLPTPGPNWRRPLASVSAQLLEYRPGPQLRLRRIPGPFSPWCLSLRGRPPFRDETGRRFLRPSCGDRGTLYTMRSHTLRAYDRQRCRVSAFM